MHFEEALIYKEILKVVWIFILYIMCFVLSFFSAEFLEVESDFHAKVPAVFCRDVNR